jgi:hypothetical protein
MYISLVVFECSPLPTPHNSKRTQKMSRRPATGGGGHRMPARKQVLAFMVAHAQKRRQFDPQKAVLPPVVSASVRILSRPENLEVDGIFRVSGSLTQIRELQKVCVLGVCVCRKMKSMNISVFLIVVLCMHVFVRMSE